MKHHLTKSNDGQMRASFRITIRLTAEEIDAAKETAKALGQQLRTFLLTSAYSGIREAMSDDPTDNPFDDEAR